MLDVSASVCMCVCVERMAVQLHLPSALVTPCAPTYVDHGVAERGAIPSCGLVTQ